MGSSDSSNTTASEGARWSNGEPVNDRQQFALAIRHLRNGAGLTRREVANGLGYSVAILCEFESGAVIPSLGTRTAFAAFYATTLEGLDEIGKQAAASGDVFPRCERAGGCFALQWLAAVAERAVEQAVDGGQTETSDGLDVDAASDIINALEPTGMIACEEAGGARGVVSPVTADNCGILRIGMQQGGDN